MKEIKASNGMRLILIRGALSVSLGAGFLLRMRRSSLAGCYPWSAKRRRDDLL